MLVTWTRVQAPPTLGGALDMHDGHPAETMSTGREIARLLSLTRRDGPAGKKRLEHVDGWGKPGCGQAVLGGSGGIGVGC